MVQITHSRIRNPQTGAYDERVAADAFDRETHGKEVCFCPDPHCSATLTCYKSYLQTFYDPETGDAYRLKIPAHYKRKAGSPAHDANCTAVKHYESYQAHARNLGVSLQRGAFIFNLNIPTDDAPAPVRRSRAYLSAFDAAAEENKESPTRRRPALSEGLNDVTLLAGLLDKTEFDRGYRDSIALRDGRKIYTLSQLFEDNPLSLYLDRLEIARVKSMSPPVIVQFKPNMLPKFHSPKSGTIQGQHVYSEGKDGERYSLAMMLHCADRAVYDAVKADIRDGKKSFLIYSQRVYVDREEGTAKNKAIREGSAPDRTFFVHIHITTPKQICEWSPMLPQMGFELAGMDLPAQAKPPKEIPLHLAIK